MFAEILKRLTESNKEVWYLGVKKLNNFDYKKYGFNSDEEMKLIDRKKYPLSKKTYFVSDIEKAKGYAGVGGKIFEITFTNFPKETIVKSKDGSEFSVTKQISPNDFKIKEI